MIIERLKKLREDKLNRKAEQEKHMLLINIMEYAIAFLDANPLENAVRVTVPYDFCVEEAMRLDISKPYLISIMYDIFGNTPVPVIEVTRRVEYRPELYY